jgi:hypothetical protein
LRQVACLHDLQVQGNILQGALAVQLPLLDVQSFPFQSKTADVPGGLELFGETLPEESWAQISGEGEADSGLLHYNLDVWVHVNLPSNLSWGVGVVQKMAEAAVSRVTRQLSAEFHAGVAAGLLEVSA